MGEVFFLVTLLSCYVKVGECVFSFFFYNVTAFNFNFNFNFIYLVSVLKFYF